MGFIDKSVPCNLEHMCKCVCVCTMREASHSTQAFLVTSAHDFDGR